jgi:CHC2 zinc finger
MARIPDEELARLKREVSLERLVAARGVKLERHGQDRLGLCPFHDDKEPSLVITPEKNLWHCLGACGKGGSVIDWVMQAEGVSFRHAVELLRKNSPSLAAPAAAPVKVSTRRKLPPPVAFDAEDEDLLAQVVAYYRQTLKEEPKALAYLGDRGLFNEEAIEHFRDGAGSGLLLRALPPPDPHPRQRARGQHRRLKSPAHHPEALQSVRRTTMPATAKREAQRVLDNLPEDATLEQIQYHLYVLQKIEEGRRAIDEGRVIPHEDVVRRMAKWLED